MLAILQFYVSSFWVWLGLTVGIWVTFTGLALVAFILVHPRLRASARN